MNRSFRNAGRYWFHAPLPERNPVRMTKIGYNLSRITGASSRIVAAESETHLDELSTRSGCIVLTTLEARTLASIRVTKMFG